MVHECAFLDYLMFSKIFKYLNFNVFFALFQFVRR